MSRILNYHSSFLPHLGGIEHNIYYFAKYSNNEHLVLTNLLPGTKKFERIDNIEVYRVPPVTPTAIKSKRRLMSHILREIPREINKVNQLKTINYDLLHLRGPYLSNDLFYGLDCLLGSSFFKKVAAWRFSKKPRVVTFHLLLSSTKFVSKDAELSFWFFNEKKSWLKYENYLCDIANEIICVDHFMIKPLEKISNGKRINYIPSGIDSTIFTPRNKEESLTHLPKSIRDILTNQFTILFLGRLDPMKGITFLNKLADILPNYVQLVQVGEGKQRVASSRIKKLNGIKNELIPHLLNVCDVVFQPSILEGISRVSLESMACGKPTIMLGSKLDRYPLIDNENGFIADNTSQVAEIITLLNKSDSLYKKISKNAILSVKEFHVQSLVSKLDQVYHNCLNDFKTSPSG